MSSMFFALITGCEKKLPPQAPSGLSMSSNHVLSWYSVSNATYYYIEHEEPDGTIHPGGGTSYNYFEYTSLSEGKHGFRVKAKNVYGESPYSSSYYYTVSNGGNSGGGSSSQISAPTNVNATKDGSRVKVSWNSVSGASYYKVYRSSSSSGSYSLLSGNVSNTYYYDNSPLSDNYYKVKAVNSSGTESDYSSYAYCQYSSGGGGGTTTIPSAPTGLTAQDNSTAEDCWVLLKWNSVSSATSYNIYRSTSSSGSYSKIGSSTYTSYNDKTPREGANYYKVKAVNSAGESDYSSYAYFNNTPTPTVQSPCPPHYTSHTVSGNTITLRWTNPTTSGCGTPTKAYLRVRHPNTGEYIDLQTLSGSATSASFGYTGWITVFQGEQFVYCGIVTENSAGTSGGLALVYNVSTGTWYGGQKGCEECNESIDN